MEIDDISLHVGSQEISTNTSTDNVVDMAPQRPVHTLRSERKGARATVSRDSAADVRGHAPRRTKTETALQMISGLGRIRPRQRHQRFEVATDTDSVLTLVLDSDVTCSLQQLKMAIRSEAGHPIGQQHIFYQGVRLDEFGFTLAEVVQSAAQVGTREEQRLTTQLTLRLLSEPAEVTNMFTTFDYSNSGVVSMKEMYYTLYALGERLSMDEAYEIVRHYNKVDPRYTAGPCTSLNMDTISEPCGSIHVDLKSLTQLLTAYDVCMVSAFTANPKGGEELFDGQRYQTLDSAQQVVSWSSWFIDATCQWGNRGRMAFDLIATLTCACHPSRVPLKVDFGWLVLPNGVQ